MGAVKRTHRKSVRIGKHFKYWRRKAQRQYPASIRWENRFEQEGKLKRIYPNAMAPERKMKLFQTQLRQIGKTMTISEIAAKRIAQNIQKTSEALARDFQ